MRIRWTRCLAHGYRVGLTADGKLVGRCPTCAAHAAQAMLKLKEEE